MAESPKPEEPDNSDVWWRVAAGLAVVLFNIHNFVKPLPEFFKQKTEPSPTVVTRPLFSSYDTGYRAVGCNANYSGCVPTAFDVDCVGGNGDGPQFTFGPVVVTGYDIYGLDRDLDGIGCEPGEW